ncbi:MAG: hypothetical protein A3K54_03105 [Omnitrophica WOR_2 bacterium RBG_13_44_8]|nr:MAG: hypothetical protein A3K54_03105 [Omnitrophica WOR_2 bacterium RBG_13_44_8]
MLQIRAKILYNKRVKDNYFHSALAAAGLSRQARPGQFLNIRVSDVDQPLLRRPFSIHRARGKNIEILYQVVGKATEILSRLKGGEYLDVLGPLGNGFDYPPSANRHPLTILVAGGMGVAPLAFLAEKLGHRSLVLIGAKAKADILSVKEFRDLKCEVKISTDNGSEGFKGKATELLKKILPLAMSHKPIAIYACGPKPMLKEIAIIAKNYKIPAQVSLEEHLACGIGACLGCAVKTKEGFKRICKEGPVFNAQEIIW